MNNELATQTKFFEPTQVWIDWMKARYPDRFVVDCGAGLGHVTQALRGAGLKKAIAIDLHPSAEFLNNYTGFYTGDACTFPFTPEMVPMYCRPCHNGFVAESVLHAFGRGCREMIYISKPVNFERDVFSLPDELIAQQVDLENIGEEGERMWLIVPKPEEEKVAKVEKDASYWEYQHKGKIPADAMLGIEWKSDEGERFFTAPSTNKETGKRIVELQLSSYVGTAAIGAMHYYAKLNFDARVLDDKGISHGGYVGKLCPIDNRHFSLNVTRRLTKVERDMNGEVLGKVGEDTYRFNTKSDAYKAALRLFAKKFGPGWVLILEDSIDFDDNKLNGKAVAET